MFGLSFWEIGIILAIALVVFGPSKLPEIAKGLGKGLREFRKATEDFKSTMNDEMYRPEAPTPRTALPPGAPDPYDAHHHDAMAPAGFGVKDSAEVIDAAPVHAAPTVPTTSTSTSAGPAPASGPPDSTPDDPNH